MTGQSDLQHLLTWLSPAFPVGGFAWSAGLEHAIARRVVASPASLREWLTSSLRHGGLRTDAIVLSLAHRAAAPAAEDGTTMLSDLADLAIALMPARERIDESTTTGATFRAAARAWPADVISTLPDPCPYPIAVGALAAAHGIAPVETLTAFLTAAVHAQISVAVRLVPLGQTQGLNVMAALEAEVAALAMGAANAGVEDIGGISYAADIAQMRHETDEPRLFRS